MLQNSESGVPVSVLILTYNEEANIDGCLRSLGWASEVMVVDSHSSDRTVDLARLHGARIYIHAFEGYARQRNWALRNLPFSHEWVLVLDADERIPVALAKEIRHALERDPQDYSGFYLKPRLFFQGRWLKHGGLYPTWILRLFRRDCGRFEGRPVNEHLVLRGEAGYLRHPFDHRDARSLNDWIAKHSSYADRVAEEYFADKSGSYPESITPRLTGSQAARKRWIKLRVWNRLPLQLRPFLLFVRNYFLRAGFLDGRPGLIYHVLWSFWYPFLIDTKIVEKQRAPSSPELSVALVRGWEETPDVPTRVDQSV